MQLRFVLKSEGLKSNVRRINLKLIMLNQLKWSLDKLFRILGDNISPRIFTLEWALHHSNKPPFSWFVRMVAQAWATDHASCQGLHLLITMKKNKSFKEDKFKVQSSIITFNKISYLNYKRGACNFPSKAHVLFLFRAPFHISSFTSHSFRKNRSYFIKSRYVELIVISL